MGPLTISFTLAAALTAFALIAYAARNFLTWALQHWLRLLLGLLAIIGLIGLWSYQAELWAWLASHLPSSGTVGEKPTESYPVPEKVTVWITAANVAMTMTLIGAIIIISAVARKAGWKRAAMLALAFLLVASAVVYSAAILATLQQAPEQAAKLWDWALPSLTTALQEIPDQAARLWDWALPKLTWAFLWVALIFLTFAAVIGLLRSDVKGVEKAAVLGGLALVFVICMQALSKYDGSRQTYANTPPRQEWGLAVAPTSPCDSREVEYTFQTDKPPTPTMPMGQCSLVLWHRNHCVYTLSYNGRIPKKACDFGNGLEGEYAVNTEYVWSADTAFTDKFRPDPPHDAPFFSFVQ